MLRIWVLPLPQDLAEDLVTPFPEGPSYRFLPWWPSAPELSDVSMPQGLRSHS